MPGTAIFHQCLVKICIAIDATVFTGIVSADIDTGNTSAGSPLTSIFSDIQRIISYPFQPLAVDATGVPDTISAQIHLFGTGIKINPVLFGNLTETGCKFIHLLRRRCGNPKCGNSAINIPVQIKKADGALFGIVHQPVTQQSEIFDMIRHCISGTEQNRVIPPYNRLFSDHRRQLLKCRYQNFIFRWKIFSISVLYGVSVN